jgi:hypothetical protein
MPTVTTHFPDWRALPYSEIWVVDTEYYPGPGLAHGGRDGDLITPLCLAAIELRSNRTIQLWQDELGRFTPYRLDRDVLIVAYMLTAEFGFHRALGWGQPANAIDAYVEFRHLVNDASVKSGDRPKGFYSLAGAARYLKVGKIDLAHKDDMRDRIIQGPPYTTDERRAIPAYNLDDTSNLAEVFKKLVPTIPSWSHALFRGEVCWAISGHEHRGVPLNPASYGRIERHWSEVDLDLVRTVDRQYGVYDIVDDVPHFREDKFHNGYRRRHGIPWPRHRESGKFDMRASCFRDMAVTYPQLEDLHALRSIRSQMRSKGKLSVGGDYRNRALLGPYGTKTGRCAWSTTKFIFGPARGLRLVIAPHPGSALIPRDYKQQEVRIAAVKSDDTALLNACESGDVYLAVARQLGFNPDADPKLRDRFKVVVLSIQYGAEAASLAIRAGISGYEAAEILARLKARFRRYEDYCASVADHAGLDLALSSEFGWRVKVPPNTNPRTVRNWPIQTAGSEILHVAVVLAERRGIPIIAPVHDALMAEGDPSNILGISHELDRCMGDASALVLRGYRIPTEEGQAMGPRLSEPRTGPIYPGEHYYDKAGAKMWGEVNRLIDNLERKQA